MDAYDILDTRPESSILVFILDKRSPKAVVGGRGM